MVSDRGKLVIPSTTRRYQAQAADPRRSIWVGANAGSGKTFVLTQRVLRLLLTGVNPQSILCLTYTKAAAAEMRSRVAEKLAEWAVMPRAELLKTRQAGNSKDNPEAHCLPMGIIQLHTQGAPRKYVQTPRELIILYEASAERREIFTDGRALPADDPQPWWNGYSVGRWDGDTLVVESSSFRDGGWLDIMGSPLTDAARITERFRRPAFGRMEIDITIEDKKAYTKPFTVRVNQQLMLDEELIEFVCLENQRFGSPQSQ